MFYVWKATTNITICVPKLAMFCIQHLGMGYSQVH